MFFKNRIKKKRFLLFMRQISYEFYIIHFIFILGVLPFVSNVWVYIPICLEHRYLWLL